MENVGTTYLVVVVVVVRSCMHRRPRMCVRACVASAVEDHVCKRMCVFRSRSMNDNKNMILYRHASIATLSASIGLV